MATYRDGVKGKETRLGWEYKSRIVCMCIIMRRSKISQRDFGTTSLLCTYKLCDSYTPIPILSPFLFTPSLYVAILNLQDFSFTCLLSFLKPWDIAYVVTMVTAVGKCMYVCANL